VLHEVNMAKVITAKEMVFNIGSFPIELLVALILRAARTQRCPVRGIDFRHGPMLPERSPWCQYAVLAVSFHGVNTP
jgi:hypothetical protein